MLNAKLCADEKAIRHVIVARTVAGTADVQPLSLEWIISA